MTNTETISNYCKDLYPEAETNEDAVLSAQKDLQRIIEFKTKYNIPAATDIEFYFLLNRTWNELKAQELFQIH